MQASNSLRLWARRVAERGQEGSVIAGAGQIVGDSCSWGQPALLLVPPRPTTRPPTHSTAHTPTPRGIASPLT